ncbi:MAG TPA: hypothetical protein VE650_08430 [Acetobacteraceae bacterium]|nr:hypothetical protein [Acetobacteraceae bacterium]
MNGKDAAPIVPVLPGATSVGDALEHARSMRARAVVEIAEAGFRLHATTALLRLHREGQGRLRLHELDAIGFGGPKARRTASGPLGGVITGEMDGPVGEVALLVTFAPVARRGVAEAGAYSYVRRGVPALVARSYQCPRDGEPFSGPGVCDLHDVDLVPANDP